MTSVFIDASALISLNNPRDQYFQHSQNLLQQLQKYHVTLITTDYVADETATNLLIHIKGGYFHACNFLNWVFNENSLIQMRWLEKENFFEAVKIFRRFNKDKLWSFTDCTSYVVMKKLKIKTVFTFDDHFEQMGFKLLE